MNKIYFLLLLSVSHFISFAQYQRLFDPAKAPMEWTFPAYNWSGELIGKQKVVYYGDKDTVVNGTLLRGDTIINGEQYIVCHNDLYYRNIFYKEDTTEGRVVNYIFNPDGSILDTILILKLSAESGDTLHFGSLFNPVTVDTTFISEGRKYVSVKDFTTDIYLPNNQNYYSDEMYFIEGMGNTKSMVFDLLFSGLGDLEAILICMQNKDSLLYMAPFTDTCGIRGLNTQVWDAYSDAYPMYPNPFSDVLYIEAQQENTQATFYIYDLTGKLVQEGRIQEHKTPVYTDKLSSGFYLVKIQNDGSVYTQKLFKP